MTPYFDPFKTTFIVTPYLYTLLQQKFGPDLIQKVVRKDVNSVTVELDFANLADIKLFGETLFTEIKKPNQKPPSFNWLIMFSFSTFVYFEPLIECLKNSKMITYFSLICKKSPKGQLICYAYIEVVKLSRFSGFVNIFLSQFSDERMKIKIENCTPRKKGYSSFEVLEAQKHILSSTPKNLKVTDDIYSFGNPRDSRPRLRY